MNNRNVVIPTQGRDLLKVRDKFERGYHLTGTEVRSGRSLVTSCLTGRQVGMTLALLLTTVVSGIAQSITPEVMSAGGGDTVTANVGLSWTIGEPVIETVAGANAMITQGFHQNHFEIVSIEEHKELGYEISVYPNPSTDFIKVGLSYIGKLPGPSETSFKLVLTDNSGKTLMSEIIKNKLEYMIPMQDYAPGQYILRITGVKGDLHKSAQIIKLN